MTVKELIERLSSFPPEMEVWYAEDFFGMPSREVADYDLKVDDGLLIIGYVP